MFKVRGRKIERGEIVEVVWATSVTKKAPLNSIHGEFYERPEPGPGPGTRYDKDTAHTVLGSMRQRHPEYRWEMRNA